MTRWWAFVPQKALDRAKGRLEVTAWQRRLLATAMLRDTVAAVSLTREVARLSVLWDDDHDRSLLPHVHGISTRGLSLNRSLELAAEQACAEQPDLGVLVVPGDLPALDPAELTLGLQRAARSGRAYVPDAEATGTTLLTAVPDSPLLPAYGVGSAVSHAATGAHPVDVTGIDTLRADVDDLESLSRALTLGCRQHTLAACAAAGLVPEIVR